MCFFLVLIKQPGDEHSGQKAQLWYDESYWTVAAHSFVSEGKLDLIGSVTVLICVVKKELVIWTNDLRMSN